VVSVSLMPTSAFRLVIISVVSLAGCTQYRGAINVNHPAGDHQSKVAIAATDEIRKKLNQGACESIYESSHTHFKSQPGKDWIAQCEDIRARLGDWQTFTIELTIVCGGPEEIVCADGNAQFMNGLRKVELIWLLNGDRAELFSLHLENGGQTIQAPPEKSPSLIG
jgi:hypothetical protein